MKISQVIDFLEGVKESHGDIEMQSITGFWVRTIPVTGEMAIFASVGDGRSIDDLMEQKERGHRRPESPPTL